MTCTLPYPSLRLTVTETGRVVAVSYQRPGARRTREVTQRAMRRVLLSRGWSIGAQGALLPPDGACGQANLPSPDQDPGVPDASAAASPKEQPPLEQGPAAVRAVCMDKLVRGL